MDVDDGDSDNDEEISILLALSLECHEKEQDHEAVLHGEKCLEMAKESGNKYAEMNASLVIGEAYQALEQHNEAIYYSKKSFDIATQTCDKNTKMKTCLCLAESHQALEQHTSAIQYAMDCLGIAKETGNTHTEMKVYLLIAEAHRALEEYHKALHYATMCLDKARAKGVKKVEMKACLVIGQSNRSLQKYNDAIEYARMCLELITELNDKESEVAAHFVLGESYYHLSRYENAILHFKTSVRIAEEIKMNHLNLWRITKMTGETYFALMKYDDAVDSFRKCVDIAKGIGDRKTETKSLFSLGKTYLELDHFDDCIFYCEKVMEIAVEIGYKRVENYAHLLLGKMYSKMKKHQEALFHGKKCIEMFRETGDKDAEQKAYFISGEAECELKNYTDAFYNLHKCIDLAKETEDKKIEKMAYFVLGEVHYQLIKYEEALFYFKKFDEIAKESGDNENKLAAYLKIAEIYSSLSAVKDRNGEMENFLALSTEYVEIGQNNEAILYGNKCINMAKELDNKQAERRAFLVVAKAHCGLKQYDEVIKHARMYLNKIDETDCPDDQMEAYDLLGEAHAFKGQYDDAITYYKVGLAVAGSDNVRKSAEMSIKIGMISYLLGSYEDAIRQCKESIDFAKTTRDVNTTMQAFYIIGRTYYESDNYDETISYCIKCLGVSDSGDKNITAAACLLMGFAYFQQHKHEDALVYSNKCMDFAKETGDAMTQAASLLLIAKTCLKLNEYAEAEAYCKKLFDNAIDTGEKLYEVLAYYFRGIIHQNLGQYDDALCNYKKGIDIAKNGGYDDIEALLHFLVGSTHQAQNQYDDAVKYFEKSIAITKKTSNKIGEMNSYLKLVQTYNLLNQEKEALLPAKKALEIAKKIGDKKAETKALWQLIKLHRSLGQQQDFAHCVDQLNSISHETGDFYSLQYGSTMTSLMNSLHLWEETILSSYFASVPSPFFLITFCQESLMKLIKYANLDDLESVPDNFLSASLFSKLENFVKNHPCSLQQKIVLSREVDYPKEIRTKLKASQPLCQWKSIMSWLQGYLESVLTLCISFNAIDDMGQVYTLIGMLQYFLKQNANAKASLLEALGCFESVFDRLLDESKITIVDRYIDTYKLLLEILIKEDKKEEALLVSERCRTQALKAILVLKYGIKQEVSQSHIQLDDIYSLVSKKFSILLYSVCPNDLLAFLLEDGNIQHFSVEPIEDKGHQMYSLERYINEAFTEIGVPSDNNEHKDDIFKPHLIQWAKLLKNANPQEVNEITEICLEALKMLPDPASDNASDSKFNPDDTISVTDLTAVLRDERIEKFKEAFKLSEDTSESNSRDATGSPTNAWEALSQKLLNKMSIKQEEIVIIPDGPLFKVPFAALRNPRTGNYLSQDKKIRLAPSLTVLKLLSECPADYDELTGALVIGDPQVGKVMQDGVERDIPSLESAEVEALVIATRFGVDPLIGPQATKPIVIEKLKQGASVVHIAAHGDLEKANILLAPSPEIRQAKTLPDEEDYMLTMDDVQQARVRAQLVVLSCCCSGRGEIRAEGVVGMCRAFLASGARAVVASLWDVNDNATLEFMSYFYHNLEYGESVSTSLQMAMNVVRQNEQYSEPKYWAPFFLMGDDVTIKF